MPSPRAGEFWRKQTGGLSPPGFRLGVDHAFAHDPPAYLSVCDAVKSLTSLAQCVKTALTSESCTFRSRRAVCSLNHYRRRTGYFLSRYQGELPDDTTTHGIKGRRCGLPFGRLFSSMPAYGCRKVIT